MSSEAEEDVCWICLCSSEKGEGLQSVCGCPRQCHPSCLARWQLQQAGKRCALPSFRGRVLALFRLAAKFTVSCKIQISCSMSFGSSDHCRFWRRSDTFAQPGVLTQMFRTRDCREERYCRFCEREYPDWKNALTPREIKPTTPVSGPSRGPHI